MLSIRSARRAALAAASSIALAAPALAAGPLSEWNLIVHNDLKSTSEVDGSALIGGSITQGTSNYSTQGVTALNGAGLAVGGNINAGVTVNINNGGSLRIGGSVVGIANRNGGGALINDPGITAQVNDIFTQLSTTSLALASLAPNGSVSGDGNMNAVPTLIDGQLVAVYSFTNASIQSLGQLNLNFGSANSVIINVSSTAGLIDLISPPNIIGGFNQANSSRILWNFFDATSVIINNSFNGALLAPGADLKLLGGGINGAVAVNNISQQSAEIRRFNYTGYIPAPGASSILAAAGLFAARRRR